MERGKNILVTGVSSGIGFGLCKALINQGINVFGISRTDTVLSGVDQKENQGKLIFKSFDLYNVEGIESLIEAFVGEGGKIDGFVHCAGIEETVPLTMLSFGKVRRIYEINVFSGIELLRVITKRKYSNDSASVVFLSSVMGELGQSGKVGYCSSKSAILGVVRSAALELVKRRIRVNAVLPGIVQTPLTEKLFLSLSEEKINEITNMHPLGVGTVDDVVPLILFLLSDQSKWVTGQSMIVDGGYSIQ